MQTGDICFNPQRPELLQPSAFFDLMVTEGARLFYCTEVIATSNPRFANGNLRRKHRDRFKAMAAPCGICCGRFGPIHYDEPSDAAHPLSFVIDEIKPVSRWREFGYESAKAAAQDWENLQAAHYCCNAAKAAGPSLKRQMQRPYFPDGQW